MRFFIIFLALIFISCKETIVSEKEISLINNSSFELEGKPSLEGWNLETNVSSSVSFSDDTPPGGGSWSVVFTIGDRSFARLYTSVFPPVGKFKYKFSIWAKSYNMDKSGSNSFARLLLNGDEFKTIFISDTTWNYYEVSGEITTGS